MPYIINKTNGERIAVVQDAALDLSTDLIFVGRNYAGYGEWQNENFLKLLENFANTIYPPKAITGQIWYDTVNMKLGFYDGSRWKKVANLTVDATNPISLEPTTGDLWYNNTEQQLYAFNGDDYALIGPPSGADTKAQWRGDVEYASAIDDNSGSPKYNIKAVVGTNNQVVALVSDERYIIGPATQAPFPKYPVYDEGTSFTIAKGITLRGADYITGRSASSTATTDSYLLWGTAAHSILADAATSTRGFSFATSPTTGSYPIPYVSSTGTASEIYSTNVYFYNPADNSVNASIFRGVATSAYYADLAERYEADSVYDEGTVVVIGGLKEVTISTEHASTAVAGVVSKNPAYLMNSEAGSDETHPAIALKGRIPCKIYGPVRKGELLVTSGHRPGYATARQLGDDPNAVIGKALEDFKGLVGIIEIKV
jgi:hypothetical protein